MTVIIDAAVGVKGYGNTNDKHALGRYMAAALQRQLSEPATIIVTHVDDDDTWEGDWEPQVYRRGTLRIEELDLNFRAEIFWGEGNEIFMDFGLRPSCRVTPVVDGRTFEGSMAEKIERALAFKADPESFFKAEEVRREAERAACAAEAQARAVADALWAEQEERRAKMLAAYRPVHFHRLRRLFGLSTAPKWRPATQH